MKKIIASIAVLSLAATAVAQMVYDYSFARACNIELAPASASSAALFDGDATTVFESPTGGGTQQILFTAETPFVLNGLSLLSADDADADPSALRFYGSNDGISWTSLRRSSTISFTGRYSSAIAQATSTKAFSQFKVELTPSASGKIKLAELQLLGHFEYASAENILDLTKCALNANGYGIERIASDDVTEIYTANSRTATIDLTFDNAATIDSYALMAPNASKPNASATAWELYGSNDGIDWEILDMRGNRLPSGVSYATQYYTPGSIDDYPDWGACSDMALNSMDEMFWYTYGQGQYLINTYHPNSANHKYSYNYWWMAHAIDAMVDAYNRTGDARFQDRANNFRLAQYQYGQWAYGRNDLWNSFYDDMEWMCLACIRAYEAFGEQQWLDEAAQLWEWIKGGWDTKNGGIQWNTTSTGKNSCSNAPAIIIACRMHKLQGGRVNLSWAKKIWDFMEANSLFDNGMVKDAPGNDDFGWTFTYNQGTWAGGSLELYKLTKDQKYYDAAVRTLDYIIDNRDYSPAGVVSHGENGGGDGGLFKGILIRYMADWVLSGLLDSERQFKYSHFLAECGRSVWNNATEIPMTRFNGNWHTRPSVLDPNNSSQEGYDASTHLSGIMLFEACDLLQRSGVFAAPAERKAYTRYRLHVTATNGDDFILPRMLILSSDNSGVLSVLADSDVEMHTSTGAIYIKAPAGTAFCVCSTDGRMVAEGNSCGNEIVLSLSSGIYVVSVITPSTRITRKLAL